MGWNASFVEETEVRSLAIEVFSANQHGRKLSSFARAYCNRNKKGAPHRLSLLPAGFGRLLRHKVGGLSISWPDDSSGFLRDLHVVDVRFTHASRRDLHEACAGAHFINRAAAAVAHGERRPPII